MLVLYLQIRRSSGASSSSVRPRPSERVGRSFLVGHDLTNVTDGVGGPSDPDLLYTPDDIVAELGALEVEKAERVLRDVADAERPAIDALFVPVA